MLDEHCSSSFIIHVHCFGFRTTDAIFAFEIDWFDFEFSKLFTFSFYLTSFCLCAVILCTAFLILKEYDLLPFCFEITFCQKFTHTHQCIFLGFVSLDFLTFSTWLHFVLKFFKLFFLSSTTLNSLKVRIQLERKVNETTMTWKWLRLVCFELRHQLT